MSKSIVSVLLSAAVTGAIAGGSIALYGVMNRSGVSLDMSGSHAAIAATLVGAIALALGYYVVRWFPIQDRVTVTTEQAMLALLAGIATLAMACASFTLMKAATSVPQMWLLPAVITAIVGAFMGVLCFGLGLAGLGERVPDHSTVRNR
jgi:hypothetical protein